MDSYFDVTTVVPEAKRTSDLLVLYQRKLWILALVFFVIGDLVTTGLGVSSGQIVEASPVGDTILNQYGMYGMVALKFGVVGLAYAGWKVVPDPERIGIPLGLAAVGVLVTGWNCLILLLV